MRFHFFYKVGLRQRGFNERAVEWCPEALTWGWLSGRGAHE